MSIAHQRALLASQRDALTARWAEKKISLHEFASGIETISMAIHLLDTLAAAPDLVTDYEECPAKSETNNSGEVADSPNEVVDFVSPGQNIKSVD